MAILARSNKEKPIWLDDTRKFCRDAGIKIMGSGPDMLTVEAKSPDQVKKIAAQLGQLGFKVERTLYAGMLDLSRDRTVVQSKIGSFDISRRRWDELIVPLIWALGSLLLVPGLSTNRGRYPYWLTLPLGASFGIPFFS